MVQLGEMVTYEGQWRGFWISPFIVLGLVKILHKILYLRLLIKGRIYPVQKLDVLKRKKKKKSAYLISGEKTEKTVETKKLC